MVILCGESEFTIRLWYRIHIDRENAFLIEIYYKNI